MLPTGDWACREKPVGKLQIATALNKSGKSKRVRKRKIVSSKLEEGSSLL
jgi:hypothetical protein